MARNRLTDAQIAEIRRLYSAKNPRQAWPVAKIAGVFGVSASTVRKLVADAPRGAGRQGYPGGGTDGILAWTHLRDE